VNRRAVSNLVAVGCLVAMACVDLSAPKGPSSISNLQLPATFVVRGDVMRDSNGTPAPPTIVAFDQNGNPVGETGATFFITDSIPHAHFVQGVVFGDSLGIAHVVGQVGNLQTPVFALPVTVAPTTIANTLTAQNDTLKAPVGADSLSSQGSVNVQVRVTGGANKDTTVDGVRVTFTITSSPPSRASSPAAFLLDDQNNVSGVDTTASGLAARKLTVISSFIADSTVRAGTRLDSVVIAATASYRGAPLTGSPLRIVIPVKVSFGF